MPAFVKTPRFIISTIFLIWLISIIWENHTEPPVNVVLCSIAERPASFGLGAGIGPRSSARWSRWSFNTCVTHRASKKASSSVAA